MAMRKRIRLSKLLSESFLPPSCMVWPCFSFILTLGFCIPDPLRQGRAARVPLDSAALGKVLGQGQEQEQSDERGLLALVSAIIVSEYCTEHKEDFPDQDSNMDARTPSPDLLAGHPKEASEAVERAPMMLDENALPPPLGAHSFLVWFFSSGFSFLARTSIAGTSRACER